MSTIHDASTINDTRQTGRDRQAERRQQGTERLIAALREMVEQREMDERRGSTPPLNSQITLSEFCRHFRISEKTVYRYAGSWKRLREAAGLAEGPCPRGGTGRDELLDRAWGLVQEHGKSLTYREFLRYAGVTRWAVERHFSRWSDLRRALGLPPNLPGARRYSDEALLDALWAFRRKHKRYPSAREVRQVCGVSWDTLRMRFGSAHQIQNRALARAVRQEFRRRGIDPDTKQRIGSGNPTADGEMRRSE
jgi:hypothetical protein